MILLNQCFVLVWKKKNAVKFHRLGERANSTQSETGDQTQDHLVIVLSSISINSKSAESPFLKNLESAPAETNNSLLEVIQGHSFTSRSIRGSVQAVSKHPRLAETEHPNAEASCVSNYLWSTAVISSSDYSNKRRFQTRLGRINTFIKLFSRRRAKYSDSVLTMLISIPTQKSAVCSFKG